MIKATSLFLCLAVCSGAIGAGAFGAEKTDSCTGLQGSALDQCLSTQQTLRQQQQLEQQLQQQQERQNELDKQQREVQQQLESMRLQNESLRQQLARETAKMERETTRRDTTGQGARPIATDYSKSADVKSWKADNPWFGSDYAKTQFAMRHVKQLQQEQPDLSGRELLDALSSKVNETFGAKQ